MDCNGGQAHNGASGNQTVLGPKQIKFTALSVKHVMVQLGLSCALDAKHSIICGCKLAFGFLRRALLICLRRVSSTPAPLEKRGKGSPSSPTLTLRVRGTLCADNGLNFHY